MEEHTNKPLTILLSMILLPLSIIFWVKPEYVFEIASFSPLKPPSIDKLAHSKKDDFPPTSFFRERNTLEVEVPRNMSFGDFIELYQLKMPHIRREIAQQMGKDSLKNNTPLKAGQRFTINLTPPAGEPTQ
ncbi:hypothetical protein PN36_19390 [Candidatus Thiomargarita nelsonii]|uniref:Uncharacterized protein n=1 Tax=Candidatus Thiomargarita nelsonii TaxID=1003181 RepID=A0A0A6PBQ8_9GAMM|nr:hypothetical protein PN36_19390 [Candidatus Thiomargarita nelsonii]